MTDTGTGATMVSDFEAAKDTVQEVTESAASHIGRIALIITGAVRDIAREIGDLATDIIEMREASDKAKADRPVRIIDETR